MPSAQLLHWGIAPAHCRRSTPMNRLALRRQLDRRMRAVISTPDEKMMGQGSTIIEPGITTQGCSGSLRKIRSDSWLEVQTSMPTLAIAPLVQLMHWGCSRTSFSHSTVSLRALFNVVAVPHIPLSLVPRERGMIHPKLMCPMWAQFPLGPITLLIVNRVGT